MTIREVKKKSRDPIVKCVMCGLSQICIGTSDNWLPILNGYVCHKDACRTATNTPLYVPPDRRR